MGVLPDLGPATSPFLVSYSTNVSVKCSFISLRYSLISNIVLANILIIVAKTLFICFFFKKDTGVSFLRHYLLLILLHCPFRSLTHLKSLIFTPNHSFSCYFKQYFCLNMHFTLINSRLFHCSVSLILPIASNSPHLFCIYTKTPSHSTGGKDYFVILTLLTVSAVVSSGKYT